MLYTLITRTRHLQDLYVVNFDEGHLHTLLMKEDEYERAVERWLETRNVLSPTTPYTMDPRLRSVNPVVLENEPCFYGVILQRKADLAIDYTYDFGVTDNLSVDLESYTCKAHNGRCSDLSHDFERVDLICLANKTDVLTAVQLLRKVVQVKKQLNSSRGPLDLQDKIRELTWTELQVEDLGQEITWTLPDTLTEDPVAKYELLPREVNENEHESDQTV